MVCSPVGHFVMPKRNLQNAASPPRGTIAVAFDPAERVMIPALTNLDPEPVWKHFDRLAAIPRASTKEAAARDYVRTLATKLGLESVQDDVGNLVIRKPARPGRERATMALLQGHLDMVCENCLLYTSRCV